MKWIKYFSIVLLLGMVTAFTLYKYKHWIRDKENPNKIELTVDHNLNINDFDVFWGSTVNGKKLLFKNGEDLKENFKEHGKNYFHINYKDSLIATFIQFKYNNWHGHDYLFHVFTTNDSIVSDLKILGPDTDRVVRTFP